MLPNRIKISKQASDAMRTLKGRTGITPNILCRIALSLSIRDRHALDTQTAKMDGTEFTLPTLLGDHAVLYECLLREIHGDLPERDAMRILVKHIDRGVEMLRRVKSAGDMLSFL